MKGIFWGILLVFLGVYLLSAQFIDLPGAENLWPLLLVLGGISLFWEYVKHRVEDTLIPATVLFLLGIFFLLFTLEYYRWEMMSVLWPLFIIIPGVAFLIMFLACQRWGVLVPAFVLLAIGGAFLAANVGYFTWTHIKRWWPSVLVVAGILVLLGALRGGKSG